MHPVRPAPADVELEAVPLAPVGGAADEEVRPDGPRHPPADAVEEGGAVHGQHQRLRQRPVGPAVERVAGDHLAPEIVARQHLPAETGPEHPDAVPDEPEPAEVGAGVDLPAELAGVRPGADREQMGREGEEEHRPDRVADVRQRVCPLPDQEAVGDDGVPPDAVDDEREHEAEDERVREADAGPAAMEPGRVARPHLVPGDPDAVDEPFREHVRRVRAREQRHERDLAPEVLLDDVWLEVVRCPAHTGERRPVVIVGAA